jgi:hypothetical protein
MTIEQIIFTYLEQGDTFRYEGVIYEGNNYELVISGGAELFVMEKVDNRYYFINDKETIKEVLMAYYEENNNLSIENQFERLEKAKEHTKNFFESRGEQEEKCKQYTGIDRLPCDDEDSCLVACRTVYICDTYSFGIGKDFVNLILSYKTNTEKLDKYEEEYKEIFDEVIEEKSLESLEEIEEYLTEISKTSKNIELNELIETYMFCPEISYKNSELTSAKSIVSDIKKSITPLYEIDKTVDTIYLETNNRKPDYDLPMGEIKIEMFNGHIVNTLYYNK